MAVCRCSAPVRSPLRCSSSLNSRTFSMAITAWSANVGEQRESAASENGSASAGVQIAITPMGTPIAQHGHREERAVSQDLRQTEHRAPRSRSGRAASRTMARFGAARPTQAGGTRRREMATLELRRASGETLRGQAAVRPAGHLPVRRAMRRRRRHRAARAPLQDRVEARAEHPRGSCAITRKIFAGRRLLLEGLADLAREGPFTGLAGAQRGLRPLGSPLQRREAPPQPGELEPGARPWSGPAPLTASAVARPCRRAGDPAD